MGSGVNVGVGSGVDVGVGYRVGVGVGSKEPASNGVYLSFVDNKVPYPYAPPAVVPPKA